MNIPSPLTEPIYAGQGIRLQNGYDFTGLN